MTARILIALLLFTGSVQADESFLYFSKCKNAHAVDGDTVDCEAVSLPFMIALVDQRFRLMGIDAPESYGKNKEPAGLASKEWLGNLVNGKDIYIATVPDRNGESDKGSFGRWLAYAYLTGDDVRAGKTINAELVNQGHAVFKDY